ncbi:MAG: DUF1819 family protein, partial [Desulfobacterales bacterium]|nr:DUF1819 family protein [Desulfobacterales bacterium]
ARAFVSRAVQRGKTTRPWSESTIRRVASYLTGCCADFGLLESGRKQVRRIRQFRLEPAVAAYLAHDLHFSGLGDNSAAAHPDWGLYGLEKEGVRDVLKRLALNGFFIIQAAGDAIRIGWRCKNWEDLIHAITERQL